MTIAVSIVSHGHAQEVLALLALLAKHGATPLHRVWLTLNVPEPALIHASGQIWPFEIVLLTNKAPMGFGANHNQAFDREMSSANPADAFCVLNPDMSWIDDPFPALLSALNVHAAGCAYPVQFDTRGHLQDHQRALPTPLALLKRHAGGQLAAQCHHPDWVNAAFLVFPRHVYAEVGGFDTRYFMYCEDVDMCLRLQLAGYGLIKASTAHVTHDASRASRRNIRHLAWHVLSLLRLWCSPVYRRFRSSSALVNQRG